MKYIVFFILIILYLYAVYIIDKSYKFEFLKWAAELKKGEKLFIDEVPLVYKKYIKKSKSFQKEKGNGKDYYTKIS
jgi:hypothetical protein